MTEFLNGRLLLSAPSLKDPNFSRTVIFICRHDADGAFGLVINKSLRTRVADALPALSGLPFAEGFLRQGGPVETDNIFLLHDSDAAGGLSVLEGLYQGGDEALLDRLVASCDDEAPPRVRLFAGYSGWSGGQLEMEMEHHAWIVANADRDLILEAEGHETWSKVLRGMGGRFALMADAPLDPDWN